GRRTLRTRRSPARRASRSIRHPWSLMPRAPPPTYVDGLSRTRHSSSGSSASPSENRPPIWRCSASSSACSCMAAFCARNWMVSERSISPVRGDGDWLASATLALNSSPPALNFIPGGDPPGVFAGSTAPELLRCDACSLGHRRELRPGDLAIPDARSDAAVRAGDYVLLTDQVRILDQSVRHQPRMLDDVGGVANHTGHQRLASRQLDVLPDPPLVLMAR